ncbi:MAG: DNA polymerase III subunit gamma/tau [Firmicutes bacterium]|nr:DNA polymerase III subunit gamma/tau [Bacillota bacterium]
MYQALYRTFRPDTFESVLGQEHIIRILKNQINTGSTGHAYLFCGTRGTGKTTMARILAKGVNCTGPKGARPCGECENCRAIRDGVFMDVIEIDAASNNSVDNIRELRESVKYPPVTGRYKVYIVDEVHMLTPGAFNALLKTLEEPPQNVMFILATTEPQKLPATILSRCLRLDFRRVPESIMREGFRRICGELGVKISEGALGLIAANADGSVRDGLSLLDQCLAAGDKEIARADILAILGTSGEEVFMEMTAHVSAGRTAEALLLLNRILDDGKDVRQFMRDWVSHYRSLLMAKFVKSPEDILNMSPENIERVQAQAQELSLAELNRCIRELSKTISEAKWSARPRVLLELTIVELSAGIPAEPVRTEAPRPAAAPVQRTAPAPAAAPAPAPVAPAPAPQASKPAEGPSAEELAPLWEKVLNDEQAQGSIQLLRGITCLKKMDEKIFMVELSSGNMEFFLQSNAKGLETIMQKYTSRTLRMEYTITPGSGDPFQGLEEAEQQAFDDF